MTKEVENKFGLSDLVLNKYVKTDFMYGFMRFRRATIHSTYFMCILNGINKQAGKHCKKNYFSDIYLHKK